MIRFPGREPSGSAAMVESLGVAHATEPRPAWLEAARRPGVVLLLALIYFLSGKIGLLMAIPPGLATPVWPPSGIALASIVLLGTRTWSGIWIGAFLLNATQLLAIEGTEVSRAVLVAVGIATGSTLQPLLGARRGAVRARFPALFAPVARGVPGRGRAHRAVHGRHRHREPRRAGRAAARERRARRGRARAGTRASTR